MPRDLTVVLRHRPGTLADATQALGRAGVNIEGGCGFPVGGDGILHVLVEDVAAARSALEASGFEVREERDVVLLSGLPDEPGSLGGALRRGRGRPVRHRPRGASAGGRGPSPRGRKRRYGVSQDARGMRHATLHDMSLSYEIRRHRTSFQIPREPTCDRCGHGASLHTIDGSVPCIGCGERLAAGGSPRPACVGFATEWFDNSRGRAAAPHA